MSLLVDDFSNIDREIRTFMVNDTERYRLILNDYTLVYAKGWINFNINLPVDGSYRRIPYNYTYDTNQDGIYAFYNDGFYSQNNNSWSSKKDSLIKTNNLTSIAADFEGWYTEKDGGRQIDSIEDVFKYTTLFNYSENNSMPQITLYAKWKVHTYTVYIKNITREVEGRIGRSTIEYNGRRYSGDIPIRNILYNTDIISYLDSHTGSKKFVSGARLDESEWQQDLREGLQGFLGWHTIDDAEGETLSSYRITQESYIYPQFQGLVVWQRKRLPPIQVGDTYYYNLQSAGGYAVKDPGFTRGQAIYLWEDVEGYTAREDIPEPYGGWRIYNEWDFPLGSADTAVVKLYTYY